MAWVRLDDQVPRHRKTLKAGPAACWLWVCGIAHCQSQLTDGFIGDEVLPMIGVLGVSRAKRLADVLVGAGLFDRVDGGYRVHDYLEHNPSRERVLQKRADDLERKRRDSGEIPSGIGADSTATRARARVVVGDGEDLEFRKRCAGGKPSGPARSAPLPGFQRLRVFRWMVDDMIAALGDKVGEFDLDGWLHGLDGDGKLLIPPVQEDRWKWLQQALDFEMRQRGWLGNGASTEARNERVRELLKQREAQA